MIARPVLIAALPTFPDEELRVGLSPYRGSCYVHIRTWHRNGEGWRPGKGAACRIDRLPWLLDALNVAEVEARSHGLLPPADAT